MRLYGCADNDESELSAWGGREMQDVSQSWVRCCAVQLANGEQLVPSAGAVLGRPAVDSCRDCEAR